MTRVTILREKGPAWDSRRRLTTSQEVFNAYSYLNEIDKEHFIAIHIDSKNKVLSDELVSVGSLSASIAHPREVFRSAVVLAAAAIIILHSHPSGDPTPSREDLELTGRMKEAGELLGIRVLDHIIIGNGCYVSLADRGLM